MWSRGCRHSGLAMPGSFSSGYGSGGKKRADPPPLSPDKPPLLPFRSVSPGVTVCCRRDIKIQELITVSLSFCIYVCLVFALGCRLQILSSPLLRSQSYQKLCNTALHASPTAGNTAIVTSELCSVSFIFPSLIMGREALRVLDWDQALTCDWLTAVLTFHG